MTCHNECIGAIEGSMLNENQVVVPLRLQSSPQISMGKVGKVISFDSLTKRKVSKTKHKIFRFLKSIDIFD